VKNIGHHDSEKGFTLTELIIVIFLLFGLVLLLFQLNKAHPKAVRILCSHNLMHVGFAAIVWEQDNRGAVPGSFFDRPNDHPGAPGTNLYRIFQTMSNHLETPRLLTCPADKERSQATNFTSDFDNSHISYFLALDAVKWDANMLLSGDRDITNGTAVVDGVLVLTPARRAGWEKGLHLGGGNIGLADGSVVSAGNPNLNSLIRQTGTKINRLAIP
jgi:prepilin-type processing-associated H-X9-DG protein